MPALPCLDLLSHGLKVPLHSVNTHRNAVDERERLRVFSEHGCEHAWDNIPEVTSSLATGFAVHQAQPAAWHEIACCPRTDLMPAACSPPNSASPPLI
jgi:hypothetical protein